MATSHLYGQFAAALATKTVNLSTDSLKVMLVSSVYTPNQAADHFASTPGANEITGTGYTAGGMALSSVSIADAMNTWTLHAADTLWPGLSASARYAVVYDSQPGSYATDPLIGYVDSGTTQTWNGETARIQWSSGIVLQFITS
jgi:hypothetical protein